MSTSHAALVAAQFGPQAKAYVASADHAKGADLERLATIVSGRPGGRVLDLGCGGGHVSFTVAPHAREVVAYDLSPDMLAAVREEAAARGLASIRTEEGVAEAMPFPDASFDFVVTRFSAHHWSDLGAGLREMRRVLTSGGIAVVIDTISPDDPVHDRLLHSIELLRDRSHRRNYTVAEWDAAMRAAGLRPASPIVSRLPLQFAPWVKRIGTPEADIRAIRSLQREMPREAAEHFELQADGSLTIDTMMMEAEV